MSNIGCPGFQTSAELDRLAARLRTNQAAIVDAANEVVDRSMAIGDDLYAAKPHIGGLPWPTWLKQHCNITERAARNYMALARNRAVIEEHRRNGRSAQVLGIKAALRLIGYSPDRKPSGPRTKTALPSGKTFNRASLDDRRAFLADLDLIKLLEALPLRMRAELQRRADYKGKPPSDDFTNKLGKTLRVALSSAAMKTDSGKAQAFVAIATLNNMLKNARHDLNEVEVVLNPARLDPKFERDQRAA